MDEPNLDLLYVEALCERAIAQGWDSGRLSYPSQSPLPFQDELKAILHPGSGSAKPILAKAVEGFTQIANQRRLSTKLSVLQAIAQEYKLSPLASDLLLIIAAPSLRGELARLYAIVANDPDRPLCDEFLLGQLFLFSVSERSPLARELDSSSPLVRFHLVRVGNGQRPFAELSADPLVIRRLQGELFARTEPESSLELRRADRSLDQLLLPAALLSELRSVMNTIPHESLRIVVRGRLGSGRRTLFAALLDETGHKMGVLDLGLLLPYDAEFPERLRDALTEAILRSWWPCIDGIEHISNLEGELRTLTRSVFRQHPGPLLFRCGAEVQPPLVPGYRLFDLPPLTEAQRATFFRIALTKHHLRTDLSDELAGKHRIGPGTIEKVIAQASTIHVPGTRPKKAELRDNIEQAIRQYRDNQIGHFASRITRMASWDQVVLPEDIKDSIYEFMGRIRHRQLVYESWGMDKILTSARGLTALFAGGPGTGKSMVASLIARDLGYELYRVDLSRILSKWIGETEQNMAKVFDIAEDGQVIILFDEADALFTKRTEVRTSVDRYANAEVNYLLQRLDSFEGIAILTTNLEKSLDKAFKRRLSLRLTFPFPDEDMREELWRVHLPKEMPIEYPLDLRSLAERYELSGGYIRNAVLRAAFLAAIEGNVVTQSHLERAVRLEYRERGKIYEGGVLE